MKTETKTAKTAKKKIESDKEKDRQGKINDIRGEKGKETVSEVDKEKHLKWQHKRKESKIQ